MLVGTALMAQVAFDWAFNAGSSGSDSGYGIAADASGNTYVTGRFIHTVDFGGDTLTSTPDVFDIFLAKYNSQGMLQWVKKASSLGSNSSYGIAADGFGNIYITGHFSNIGVFGQGEANMTTLESTGNRDIFIAKYEPSGNLKWARHGGGSGDDRGFGVTFDAVGNVFITGWITGTVNFDSLELFGDVNTKDIVVAKYASGGALLWVKRAGGPGDDYGRDIATDLAGNSYVTGFFKGSASFGLGDANPPVVLSTANPTDELDLDIFVAKYGTDGELQWVRQAGGDTSDSGYRIKADAAGNSYVTGWFVGDATFSQGVVLESNGSYDMFVARYDANGNLLWARTGGGASDDRGLGVAIDPLGNSYVTGYYAGATATYGLPDNPVVLTSPIDGAMVFAKYDKNGLLQWVRQDGNASGDTYVTPVAIAVNSQGNIYITGDLIGSGTFAVGEDNQTTLVSNGDADMFVAKYSQPSQSSLYVWRDPGSGRNGTPIDQDAAAELADFAVAEGIGTIHYDNWGCGTAPDCPAGAEAQSPAVLAPIIALFHEKGLSVEALYTDNTRILDVVSYNNSVSPGARFDAIRLDIESFPNGGTQPATANDLELYAAAVANAGSLPVYVSIGHTWDNPIVYPSSGGIEKPAYEHIIDIVTGVDVQTAQDNSGTGPDARAIERLTKEEVCYANSLGKRVDVTIETYDVVTNLGLNAWNTFFDEGEIVMKNVLSELDWTAPNVNPPCTNPKPSGLTYHFYRQSYGSSDFKQRKIEFAGHTWIVRQATAEGPGPNNWSADPQSVWVDGDGLHLKIRYDAFEGKWYSAQVYTDDFTLYGLHRFNITTPAGKSLDALDKNVVLGLFLSRDYPVYSAPSEAGVPFEIDLEFARWGWNRPQNIDYVVWHTFEAAWNPANRWVSSRTMNLGGSSSSSHFIDWWPDSILFSNYEGYVTSPGAAVPLCYWNTADSSIMAADIPKEEKELRVLLNLWLIDRDTLTIGEPPSDGQEVEIIIQDAAFPIDTDSDGIYDEVDNDPDDDQNTAFSDVALGGQTAGAISEPGDQTLKIMDSSDPFPNNGVLVYTHPSGGAAPAIVTACGGSAVYNLMPGKKAFITCGSVTTKVLAGPVEISFTADDGTLATTSLNAGNTLTFEPTTKTFIAPATNTSTTEITVGETVFSMPPGESITIAQFGEFEANVEIRGDEFTVAGSFTLGVMSNGIDPLTEDVVVEIGTFTAVLPADSFDAGAGGSYEYQGSIGGTSLEMNIIPLGNGAFSFILEGEGADFTGTFNPVTVVFRIWDDAGTVSVTADWYCGNNKVLVCHNGNTICISQNALQAHLNHGDYKGPCVPSGAQNYIVPGGRITSAANIELDIFPNPAMNEVRIQLSDAQTSAELVISNQLGKTLWTRRTEEGQAPVSFTLDDRSFGPGIYFVTAIAGGKKITRRLVVLK